MERQEIVKQNILPENNQSMLEYSIPNRHGRNVEQSNKVETRGQKKTIKGSTFFAFRGKKVEDIVDICNGIMEGKGRRYGETQIKRNSIFFLNYVY